jgi:hypothetical protein
MDRLTNHAQGSKSHANKTCANQGNKVSMGKLAVAYKIHSSW